MASPSRYPVPSAGKDLFQNASGSSEEIRFCSIEPAGVQGLDAPGLGVGERRELLLPRPLRQAPATLLEKGAQALDLPVRHLHDLLDARREAVEGLQKAHLVREVVLHGLSDRLVEELGVRGGVEVPVVATVSFSTSTLPSSVARQSTNDRSGAEYDSSTLR